MILTAVYPKWFWLIDYETCNHRTSEEGQTGNLMSSENKSTKRFFYICLYIALHMNFCSQNKK